MNYWWKYLMKQWLVKIESTLQTGCNNILLDILQWEKDTLNAVAIKLSYVGKGFVFSAEQITINSLKKIPK